MIFQLNQTAVYWGVASRGVHSTPTFSAPVEIRVRWQDSNEMFTSSNGEELRSQAIIFTEEVLDLDGCLFLGTLSDLDSAQEEDPLSRSDTHQIKSEKKDYDLGGALQLRRYMV